MRFFFYGIFLDRNVRYGYGITSEPEYATVKDYLTIGHHIVVAIKVPKANLALTGIVVTVPDESIEAVDLLESGYERIKVKTDTGELVYMYAEIE